MKKKILIFILVILAVYLNRTYAHIYKTIDSVAIDATNTNWMYQIQSSSSKNLTYVALGDSLTAGVGVDSYAKSYPYLLAQKLSQKNTGVTIIPLAVPGAKTSEISNELVESAIRMKPDIVTILIGVNDIHSFVSKKSFQDNYENILRKLLQETKAKVYIIAIPYIGSEKLIQAPYNWYFDYQTQAYNKILQKIAEEYGVTYVDLYNSTRDISTNDPEYYSVDMFHPSEMGYTLWTQSIYASLNQ